MKIFILLLLSIVLMAGCRACYHRVMYAEMPIPPKVTLAGNKLIVTTRNENGEGLSVYKVDIEMRDRLRMIELKGYQALGKPEKTEFTIVLSEAQTKEIKNYRIYWIDPGGKKSRIKMFNEVE